MKTLKSLKSNFALWVTLVLAFVAIAAATMQRAQAHPTDLVGVQAPSATVSTAADGAPPPATVSTAKADKITILTLILTGAGLLGTVLTGPTTSVDERAAEILFLPMAASTKIYAGAIVCIDTSGRAVNAADTATLRVIGRAEETVDNSAGAAGDLFINVKRGCFRVPNSGTNAITAAMIGNPAYIEDNNTVASTSTNKIVAGVIMDVETAGVWVDTRRGKTGAKIASTISAAVATTAASNSTPYGYTTQAQADALVARVNELRTAVLEIQTALNS